MPLSELLIGLSGMPRAGKDTVASLLEEEFPGINRTNFSFAIAEEYDATHGTNTRYDEEEKVAHRDGFGELANRRRGEDPLYWLVRTLNKPRPLIVAGVRSVGEADAVHEQGGVLVRIIVSQKVLEDRMGEHFYQKSHYAAEHHLDSYDKWDHVIENNGSVDELKEKVHAVAEQIRQKYQG